MNIDDNGFINLSNGLAECKISLWGANIVSYRPKNEEHDIFWLGELNKFDNVQAIRGGVPICWPRFAEEKLNGRLPRHGFARISGWNLKNVSVDENKIEARLFLLPDAKYDVNITADLFIKITDKIHVMRTGIDPQRSAVICCKRIEIRALVITGQVKFLQKLPVQ